MEEKSMSVKSKGIKTIRLPKNYRELCQMCLGSSLPVASRDGILTANDVLS